MYGWREGGEWMDGWVERWMDGQKAAGWRDGGGGKARLRREEV